MITAIFIFRLDEKSPYFISNSGARPLALPEGQDYYFKGVQLIGARMNILNLKSDNRNANEHSTEEASPSFRVLTGIETTSTADKEMIALLRSEVLQLQASLRDAERKIIQYEQLLKNSRQRERDLRSQLGNRS